MLSRRLKTIVVSIFCTSDCPIATRSSALGMEESEFSTARRGLGASKVAVARETHRMVGESVVETLKGSLSVKPFFRPLRFNRTVETLLVYYTYYTPYLTLPFPPKVFSIAGDLPAAGDGCRRPTPEPPTTGPSPGRRRPPFSLFPFISLLFLLSSPFSLFFSLPRPPTPTTGRPPPNPGPRQPSPPQPLQREGKREKGKREREEKRKKGEEREGGVAGGSGLGGGQPVVGGGGSGVGGRGREEKREKGEEREGKREKGGSPAAGAGAGGGGAGAGSPPSVAGGRKVAGDGEDYGWEG
ncbi:hypothetical protein TIFTF001_007586 [Ficus carica]|uniref:Uncharacterized protein n=1 Tax=Ficus carica TaxID=3494 RepID=A0AA88A6X4_FICCA|nr:hypothetical protein TIFTF001_007586 [Ficus carica]